MPPRKKSKTAGTARRMGKTVGRKGTVDRLTKMPKDILREIFSVTHPRDLLSLARTTKEFRALLMSRGAASCWKKARDQVSGLPALPAHLSEPQYANLAFFEHCHECLRTTNVNAYWAACARYCDTCVGGFERRYYGDRLGYIEREFDLNSCHFVTMIRESPSIVNPRELEEFMRLWSRLKTAGSQVRFLNKRVAFVAERKEFEKAMTEWQNSLQAQKEEQQAAWREKRMSAIMEMLRHDGWGTEIDAMTQGTKDNLWKVEGVSDTKEPTKHGWRILMTRVRQFMTEVKAKRIKKERPTLIRVRVGYLKIALYQHQYANWDPNATDRVYVRPGDCLWMPEIRAIIEDTSEEATKEDLIAMFTDVLPGLTSRWVNERRAEYTARLAKALGDSEGMKVSDPLKLVSADFHCCERSHLFLLLHGHREDNPWTRILNHHCFHTEPEPDADYEDCNKSDLRRYDPALADQFCRCSRITEIQREVIKSCGRDPNTTTLEELDACGVRLRCILCAMMSKQETFDWKAAICHDADKHSKRSAHEVDTGSIDPSIRCDHWQRISEEDAATVRQLESAILDGMSTAGVREYGVHYRCRWCGFRACSAYDNIRKHIKDEHSKANAQLGADYYLDAPRPPPIVMYTEAMADLDSTARSVVASGRGFFVPRERV